MKIRYGSRTYFPFLKYTTLVYFPLIIPLFRSVCYYTVMRLPRHLLIQNTCCFLKHIISTFSTKTVLTFRLFVRVEKECFSEVEVLDQIVILCKITIAFGGDLKLEYVEVA